MIYSRHLLSALSYYVCESLPHQSPLWSRWAAADTPNLLYWHQTRCKTLWSLGWRRTSHTPTHMTDDKGPDNKQEGKNTSWMCWSSRWQGGGTQKKMDGRPGLTEGSAATARREEERAQKPRTEQSLTRNTHICKNKGLISVRGGGIVMPFIKLKNEKWQRYKSGGNEGTGQKKKPKQYGHWEWN